jgi:adenylate cyclase
MKAFFRDLRERSVIKVSIAYLVVAWVVLQLADVIFPAMNLPDWSISLVLGLLAIGFPVAIVLAWAFDLTPEGIRRASKGDDGESEPQDKALSTEGSRVPALPVSSTPSDGHSIAVLPFADMSPDGDQEHFCDGLTEELLNVMSCIPGLRVSSRTSSFAFKGSDVDIATVAGKLNVDHVLEGSVRKDGDKVRITAQLIEVSSDSHRWSETYDRELCDIFSIQDDIAAQILEALRLKLGDAQLPLCTTSDPKAYEYYLRGRGYFFTKTDKDLNLAIDMFEKAAASDPNFVKAWIDLAEAASMSAIYLGGDRDYVSRAEDASKKAMTLAPDRADSQMACGFAHLAARRFAEAEAYFLNALELDPGQVKAWHYLARAAHHLGKKDEELKYFHKATELDKEDWESPLLAAGTYRANGDMEAARRMAEIGVERVETHLKDYPDNPRAYYLALGGLYYLDEFDKADRFAEQALSLAPDDGPTRYNIACYYAVQGEANKALDLLEGSTPSRSWIENDSDWDNIRQHPRFIAFIENLAD